MAVNGDEEPRVELKGAGELLHELPDAFQELVDDRRDLFRVSLQVVASGEEDTTVRSKLDIKDARKVIFNSQTCERTCVQMRSSLSQLEP